MDALTDGLVALLADWQANNPIRVQRVRELGEFIDGISDQMDLETMVPRSEYRRLKMEICALDGEVDALRRKIREAQMRVDAVKAMVDDLAEAAESRIIAPSDLRQVAEALEGVR